MSEKCEFYRVGGVCADVDGDETCEFAERWEDCRWYMPADPYEDPDAAAPDDGPTREPANDGKLRVVYLPVSLIDHHPDNPRRSVGDVTELAASIRAEGIQQPLTVIGHVAGEPGRYTAVIGHRRLEAAKAAGLTEVPVFVREMDRREQLRTMMTENTQREDLTPLEEADGFQQIMLELPEQTAAAVARETGFSETTVRRRMRLLELPREAVEKAQEAGVTMADYEELNKIKDPQRRSDAAKWLGTPSFRGEVERQVQFEKELGHVERLAASLVKKGAVEITREEWMRRRAELRCEQTFYSWNLKHSSVGPLAKDQQWLFMADRENRDVQVYRVLKAAGDAAEETAEKSDVELARKELKARTDLLREELEGLKQEQIAQDQEFLDRRTEFIEGFSTFARNREEIMEAAVMTLVRGCWWSADALDELGNWLNVADITDPAELARCIRANPEKALLYTLYVKLERDAPGWHTSTYYNGMEYRIPYEQPKQVLLYDVLRLLGYRPQGDELLAAGGAHTLYTQAPRLIEQYKKDKKELEKRINA